MSTLIRPLDESLVSDLRAAVAGDVITPTDETYHQARAVWNGRIDRFPAAIVRVTSTDDVAAAIRFAREHDRQLTVRGGGHHVTGSAVADDGIVIDCSALTDVTVDPEARTVRVGAGARISDVLPATGEHGLAIPCGSAAHNGVAGSTLGGAIGWARRKHGLGVDALRSVELVTVDGETLTASATENEALFWGVRGGGANFGVVTAFEFECFELGPEVAVAQVAYPAPDSETTVDLLRRYREYVADAPDEVTSMAIRTAVPPLPFVPAEFHGAPIVMFYAVYAGDAAEGEAVLRPLRDVAEPAMDLSGRMPFLAVHEIANELFPSGNRYSWHSLYAEELSDDLAERVAEAGASSPGPEAGLTLWHMGGAVSDVPSDATAYAWRDAAFLVSIDAGWRDPVADGAHLSWAESTWNTLRASEATLEGFYPGFPGFVTGDERARMAYGDNLDRLADLKAEYDPENLLHSNLNVTPSD
jgi:FAD/FMN-containing dehydrogenase